MKAVRIHEYGNLDVLKIEEIPIPECKDDDLLIHIHATSVNPIDWKIREGYLQGTGMHTLPLTLGWDVSGVVTKTGSNVKRFKIGDEVYTRPAVDRNGSYAEYIAVKEEYVDYKPSSISHLEAASIPLAGLTAWASLVTTANIQSGQRVLIHGAAGGVGSIAVQIARGKGCYVIGTASEKNLGWVRNLGAQEAIDYHNQDFTALAKEMDVVFDTIGGATLDQSWKVLKPGGFLVSIAGHPNADTARTYNVRSSSVMVQPDAGVLAQLRHLIDTGNLKPTVGMVYSLDEIRKAMELSQTGHTRGKIAIQVV